MNIGFFDALFPRGHRGINEYYINLLSADNNVFVFANPDWFKLNDDITIVGEDWIDDNTKKQRITRLDYVKNSLKFLSKIRKLNLDILFFASYDIITMLLVYLLNRHSRPRIVLQEHNNVDQLENRVKRRIYDIYKNHYRHVVFEDYIKDELIHRGVHEALIDVVPHPCKDNHKAIEKESLCIALSNSNDEGLIHKIIEYYDNSNINNETKIVMKSTKQSHPTKNHLEVINGWLSDNDYQELFCKARYVMLPFPKSYSYRVSGAFMEAIANCKLVIANDFELMKYYKEKYPAICNIFTAPDEIQKSLKFNESEYLEQREQFLQDHSEEIIKRKLTNSFNHSILK